MIVIAGHSLDDLAAHMVEVLTRARDHHGRVKIMGTIDPTRLRSAAIAALTSVAGEVVWPDDEVIERASDADGPLPLVFVKGMRR
jgi:hypothetical protein